MPGRGARLIVDLNVIERNVQVICAHVNPGTRVMAVVKAGGYGHGAPQAAKAALAGGAVWLAVATIAEGIELRTAGIDAPILVLSPTMRDEWRLSLKHRLDITAGSMNQVEGLCGHAGEQGRGSPHCVHLKVNTGMNRYGVDPGDALSAARQLQNSSNISLRGIYTHFASADDADARSTRCQADIFQETLLALEREDLLPAFVHASNSASLLRFREYDFNMVRAGICVYGVRPAAGVGLFEGMKPALRMEAQLQRVAILNAGDRVGYGGTFTAREPVRIGLLPFGYADGYQRALSSRAWVGLRGTALPVSGRVSMDQTTVSLPDGCNAVAGNVVTVIGDGSHGEPSLEALADMASTIPYEIMTSLGLRLPVFYVRGIDVVDCNNN